VKREVIVRRLAERHLAEAFAWYEQQAAGLGADFLNQFEAVLPQLAQFPESCPMVFLDFRRALMRRFPFGIF
jgi:hypothetical protein